MLQTVLVRGTRLPVYKIICRRCVSTSPVVSIRDATFYRAYPSSKNTAGSNPAIFERLNYTLHSHESDSKELWAVVSPSSVCRTSFLQILAGQHIAIPPSARRYPYLTESGTSPHKAIKYVGFDADRGSNVSGTSVRGAYLSARYESRREETDFSVRDYLLGNTSLNALETDDNAIDQRSFEDVTVQLNLGELLDMPVSSLSNGQTRRARIAKALMTAPELLLLDGPFMGLDPNTVHRLSGVLNALAQAGRPRLVISLRPEDGIPQWINRLLVINEQGQVLAQDEKSTILANEQQDTQSILHHTHDTAASVKVSKDGFAKDSPPLPTGETVIEMQGVKVSYGGKTVLGDWKGAEGESRPGLWWSLHRGQRCGIFGPNGSGKTTMLSLITSDHPQTYSLPIKLFGRSRLPKPGELGITLFDLQRRMGHSSPEVHAFFPKRLSLRRALESAWADAPMARLDPDETAKQRVDSFLAWFADELRAGAVRPDRSSGDTTDWAEDVLFGELSFSSQRLALFLRAIIAGPDLVILDEAFSGMDEPVRDKALLFLSHGETRDAVVDGQARDGIISLSQNSFEGLTPEQALLVISHAKEDVPGCIREWICLPEPGEGRRPRTGKLNGPLELNAEGWNQIWDR